MERTHRINQQIRVSPIRVVNENGEQLGIVSTPDALKLADAAGLDLVEVAPQEQPPVCRIMDFGKFKYQQKKRQHNKSKHHQTQLKEVRVRPRTDVHDIDVKVNRARQFLAHKDKVLISMQFRGREMAHIDRGKDVVVDMIAKLEDVAKVEKQPTMEGRRISAILAPRA